MKEGIYRGEFLNGKPHARGAYESYDKSTSYNGDWVYGLKGGSGREVVGDSLYEGPFLNGIRHGKNATLTIGRFYTYTGDF